MMICQCLNADHCAVCEEWVENFFKEWNFFDELYRREDNVQEKYRGLVWADMKKEQRQQYGEIREEDHLNDCGAAWTTVCLEKLLM